MISRKARAALGALSLGALLSLSQLAFAGPIDSDSVVITEAESREGRASSIPWSGIWWAFSDLELATGWNGTGADFEYIDGQGWERKNPTKDINEVSPLLKYDAFVEARTGTNPKSALKECEGDESHDFGHSIYGEKKAEYDRDGISYSWWGHCNGWCAAALIEKEPIAPVVAEGIRFEVADLKGLLSETFWGVESDFTGRRYNKPRALYSDNRQAGKDLLAALENGSPDPVADYIDWYETVYQQTMSESAKANAKPEDFRDELEGFEDWFVDRYDEAFSDMEPHVLHGLLETVIGRKKLAFVMDVTANEEVWNHPAFAYTSDISHKRDFSENGKNFKEWDVETKVWYATDGVSHSILGIKDFYKTYNYTMVTDESDKVIRSEWVGNSIDNHPDFAWLPTHNPAGSAGENPNVRYDEIQRILPKVHRASEDRALNIAANGVTAPSQRDEDKTTTWANPIASGRTVALTAAVSAQENIRKVRYFEQKVDSYSTYAIVENEPLIALGESSAGPDFAVSAEFTSNGRKMVVAFAYDSANRLIAYDEISLQISNSGTGGNNTSSDDNFEPNNSQSAASTVNAGSYPNLNCKDDDWFKVTLPNSGDLKFEVEFTHSDGDLDITVHSSSDQIGKSDSTNNRESVELTNQPAGTYFVRIYGYNGAKNEYSLTVTAATATTNQGDTFEPNNSRSAAKVLVPGDYPTLECNDDDWFKVVITAQSKLSAKITFQHSDGDLDFLLTDSSGNKIASSESTADVETVEESGLAAGTYYLRVFGYNGAKAPYALNLTVEAETSGGGSNNNGDDSFEDNDTQSTAANITAGEHSNLVCKDQDYYKITVPANGSLSVKIRFQHSTGDLDMFLTDASGTVISRSESTSDEETVTKSGLAAGTYYIRVFGYDGAEAPYSMTVGQ